MSGLLQARLQPVGDEIDAHLTIVRLTVLEAAICTAVEPPSEPAEVQVFAKGGKVRLDSLRAWNMKPARFDLSRFTA